MSGEISWVCEGVCMIDCLRAVNRDTGLNFGIIVGIRPDFPSLDTSSWWRAVFFRKSSHEKSLTNTFGTCVCVCVFLVFVRAVIMELFLVVSTFFGAMQYFTQNRICYCVCVCVCVRTSGFVTRYKFNVPREGGFVHNLCAKFSTL